MPSPVSPVNPPTYLIVNSAGTASLTVAPQQAAGPLMQVVITDSGAGYTGPGSVAGFNSLTGGSGYVNGTYTNVSLTGGTGTGATADVIVTGNAVTSVSIVSGGTGYLSTDSLSANNTNLGGSGTGFSVIANMIVEYDISLTGGTGANAKAAIVITGNVVTGVTVTNNGTSPYAVSDSLTVAGGSATVIVSYLPSAGSTLELSGVNALNWGNNIWESLYRLTENFASLAANPPGTNVTLGGANVTPLAGQLWYATDTQTMSFWNGTTWIALAAGTDVTSVTASGTYAAALTISPSTGAVQIQPNIFTSSAAGVVPLSGGGTANFLRADGTWAAPPSSGGSVTSVAAAVVTNAASSPALVITGSPITTSGTLTFNISPELNGIAALSNLGLFKRTGVGTYAAATSSDIVSALGYTPYNATNPAGYLTPSSTITLTGNVTGSGPTTGVATTIANNVVTNAKLAQAAGLTLKGNNSSGTANVADLTGSQVIPLLPVFTSTTNGVTPSSGGGTSKFLRADGTWQVPSGGGFSLSPNGYYTLPGGFMIQWGSLAYDGSSGYTITFPTAFPTTCVSAQISQPQNVSYGYAYPILSISRTNMVLGSAPGATQTLWWVAFGY